MHYPPVLLTDNHFFITFLFKLFVYYKKRLTFAPTLSRNNNRYDKPTYIQPIGSPAHYSRRGHSIKSVRKDVYVYLHIEKKAFLTTVGKAFLMKGTKENETAIT